MRQLVAAAAERDRSACLRKLRMPALVLHGDADPVIPVSAARQIATAVPKARLEIVESMGHDLPEPLMPALVAHIVTLMRGCETPR